MRSASSLALLCALSSVLVQCGTRPPAGPGAPARTQTPPAAVVLVTTPAASAHASTPPDSPADDEHADDHERSAPGFDPELDEIFQDCVGARGYRQGERAAAIPARTPGRLRVVPDLSCLGGPSGWAGIGLWASMHLLGFSADSRVLVASCSLFRVGTAVSEGTICQGLTGIDGTPLAENPSVAKRLKALRAPAPEGSWTRDDLLVRWTVAASGGLSFELERDDGTRRTHLASFDGPYTIPHVLVSPDGKWLALVGLVVRGGYEPKFVNVAQAAARVGP